MKKASLPICLLALLLSFSGCAGKETPTPSASPSASPSQSPTVTMMPSNPPGAAIDDMLPDMTDMPGTDETLTPTASGQPAARGVTSTTDARKAIEDIENELERLSEVEDAQVVIAGNDAAVALNFDKQYQGSVDDRLRKMVEERIAGIISGVKNIAITTDPTLMQQLEELGDRLEGAADMQDIQNELNAIINKIDTAKA